MKHNLFFGVVIAPYRVDLCNWLYEQFDCDIYHEYRTIDTIGYDLETWHERCRFDRKYLETRPVCGRLYARGLRALIRSHRPEYVFVPEFSPVSLQVLWIRWTSRRRFKVICISDDSMDMIRGNDFSVFHRFGRFWMPHLFDEMLLVNGEVATWYQRRFGKGRVLPILADEKRFREDLRDALPLANVWRNQYGLEGKRVVLFVGRLIALKQVDLLIRSMAGVPDAQLVVIGAGEEESALREEDRRAGTGTWFLGQKSGEELMAWYNLADVLVLPSVQEAFGAVVNEALMAGCQVVVSCRAGAGALVSSTNGALFDPEDEAALRTCIQEILSSVDVDRPLTLRPNRMPVDFETLVHSVLDTL